MLFDKSAIYESTGSVVGTLTLHLGAEVIFSLEIEVNSPESSTVDVIAGFSLEIDVSSPESSTVDVFQEAEEVVDGVVNPDTSHVNGPDEVGEADDIKIESMIVDGASEVGNPDASHVNGSDVVRDEAHDIV